MQGIVVCDAQNWAQEAARLLPHASNTKEVDLAITEVDSEIALLLLRRSLLRTCRNTFAPIFSFPAEIFLRIFEICVSQCEDTASRVMLLITLTHVCRYWRHAVLEEAHLWTHADFTHPEIGYAMMSRARDHLVSLTFPFTAGGRHRQLQGLGSILARKDHLMSLDITATCIEMQHDFHAILFGPAPALECLRLTNADVNGTTLELRPDDLPESAPHLRELKLTGFILPSTINTLPNLRHLSICNLRCSSYSPVANFFYVLTLLQQFPALAEFELQQEMLVDRHFRHAPLTPPESSLQLSSLRHLKLDDRTNMIPIGLLLRSLSSPSLDRLSIRSREENPVSLHQTGEWLRDWIQMSSQKSLRSLSLFLDLNNFNVTAQRCEDDLTPDGEGLFELWLERDTWSAAVEHFFFGFVHCEHVPVPLMSQLTTLDLTAIGLDDVTPQTSLIKWDKFASLPALTHLSMDEIPCWSFLNFVQDPHYNSARSTPFPVLQHLTLRNVIMWQALRTGFGWEEVQTIIHSLAEWLGLRKAVGAPIHDLSLRDCYCLNDPQPELHPLVQTFTMQPPFV